MDDSTRRETRRRRTVHRREGCRVSLQRGTLRLPSLFAFICFAAFLLAPTCEALHLVHFPPPSREWTRKWRRTAREALVSIREHIALQETAWGLRNGTADANGTETNSTKNGTTPTTTTTIPVSSHHSNNTNTTKSDDSTFMGWMHWFHDVLGYGQVGQTTSAVDKVLDSVESAVHGDGVSGVLNAAPDTGNLGEVYNETKKDIQGISHRVEDGYEALTHNPSAPPPTVEAKGCPPCRCSSAGVTAPAGTVGKGKPTAAPPVTSLSESPPLPLPGGIGCPPAGKGREGEGDTAMRLVESSKVASPSSSPSAIPSAYPSAFPTVSPSVSPVPPPPPPPAILPGSLLFDAEGVLRDASMGFFGFLFAAAGRKGGASAKENLVRRIPKNMKCPSLDIAAEEMAVDASGECGLTSREGEWRIGNGASEGGGETMIRWGTSFDVEGKNGQGSTWSPSARGKVYAEDLQSRPLASLGRDRIVFTFSLKHIKVGATPPATNEAAMKMHQKTAAAATETSWLFASIETVRDENTGLPVYEVLDCHDDVLMRVARQEKGLIKVDGQHVTESRLQVYNKKGSLVAATAFFPADTPPQSMGLFEVGEGGNTYLDKVVEFTRSYNVAEAPEFCDVNGTTTQEYQDVLGASPVSSAVSPNSHQGPKRWKVKFLQRGDADGVRPTATPPLTPSTTAPPPSLSELSSLRDAIWSAHSDSEVGYNSAQPPVHFPGVSLLQQKDKDREEARDPPPLPDVPKGGRQGQIGGGGDGWTFQFVPATSRGPAAADGPFVNTEGIPASMVGRRAGGSLEMETEEGGETGLVGDLFSPATRWLFSAVITMKGVEDEATVTSNQSVPPFSYFIFWLLYMLCVGAILGGCFLVAWVIWMGLASLRRKEEKKEAEARKPRGWHSGKAWDHVYDEEDAATVEGGEEQMEKALVEQGYSEEEAREVAKQESERLRLERERHREAEKTAVMGTTEVVSFSVPPNGPAQRGI